MKDLFESMDYIKLFHGCDTDLKLLHTNFGIHLLNLFDCSKAYMKITNEKNSVSLQFLSNKYLNVFNYYYLLILNKKKKKR